MDLQAPGDVARVHVAQARQRDRAQVDARALRYLVDDVDRAGSRILVGGGRCYGGKGVAVLAERGLQGGAGL